MLPFALVGLVTATAIAKSCYENTAHVPTKSPNPSDLITPEQLRSICTAIAQLQREVYALQQEMHTKATLH